ncbi:hypothetical protein [Virgibacillus sp. YIM 98842]|uniref:hypothetical protein n=1 Tax=Virgibacillus sp. YIM 98842 TaxID=2663533 RepID=UPI0013DB9D4E|nr:hypothetical protein [Virgibacillus sp. YIM 98842]
MEQKLLELEKRTEQLEKKEKAVYSKIKDLENEIDVLLKQEKLPFVNVSENKVHHLTEVNEEMFRQNVRLRELIEYCIAEKEVPTQEKYYEALLAANEES